MGVIIELNTLNKVEDQLIEWFEELPFNNYNREDCIVKEEDRIKLRLFTETSEYVIHAIPKNEKRLNGYLICIARYRKFFPGETYRRGSNLLNGDLTKDTWDSIIKSIVGNELVEIYKPVNSIKNSKCIRCGECCLTSPCPYGEKDPQTGGCSYLYFEDGLAVCPFIRDGRIEVMYELQFESGCIMKSRKIYG